jgi:heme/copper-type cytochrome/quinol oxidase subunit 1
MPRLSVWMVRTALVALTAGAMLGALMLAAPATAGVARWRPLHAELLLVGWTVQLAFGVAYWILPRFRSGPERGHEALGWVAFALVNAGMLLAGLGRSVSGGELWAFVGRSAEGLAAAAFVAQAWPRVKPFR